MPDTATAQALLIELSARERLIERRRDDLIAHCEPALDLVDALERDCDRIRCDLDRIWPAETRAHA